MCIQGSLWQNTHLSNSIYLLEKLQTEEAIKELNLALKGTIELKDSQEILDAALYWQPRLQSPNPQLDTIIADVTGFSFLPRIFSFKRSIIKWIAEQATQKETAFNTIEKIFDLLLKESLFAAAETFITSLLAARHPEQVKLYYFWGQAQWHNKGKGKANKTYVIALLLNPEVVINDRIENQDLKKLITKYGPAMTPAYSWVESLIPDFVRLKEPIEATTEQHKKALASYSLLQQADAIQKKAKISGNTEDKKQVARCRKELKETAPELFQTYFDLLLNRRKIPTTGR